MAQAILHSSTPDTEKIVATAAHASGDLYQAKDGRAAVVAGLNAVAIGDTMDIYKSGIFTVLKTATVVILDGGRVYWDTSANKANFRKVNRQDFYIGRAYKDAASADTTMKVSLNVDPKYDIDISRDPFTTAIVGTATTELLNRRGGAHEIVIAATNEAAKVDILSVDGFSITAKPIIEGAFRVIASGAATVVDINLGIANGTHATDADQITEQVFIHLDENVTTINAQSKDGTTTVASTDTTTVYIAGAAVANRKEFWMDLRDPTHIAIYIDGVQVLASTVFTLGAGTGPEFLLAHVEKTSSTDTYTLAVDWLRARFSTQ